MVGDNLSYHPVSWKLFDTDAILSELVYKALQAGFDSSVFFYKMNKKKYCLEKNRGNIYLLQ